MELTHAYIWKNIFNLRCKWYPSKGTDTMLRCNLPVAFTYDGTSCFNFMKELVSRYYGEANPKVFTVAKELRMSEETAAKYKANSHFLTRLFKIALGVYKNCDHWAWHLATVDKFGEQLDNYALPPQFWTDENGKERCEYKKLICNWNKEESTDLVQIQSKRYEAFIGMAYTAIKAWEMTFGNFPSGVMQQHHYKFVDTNLTTQKEIYVVIS